MKTNATLMKNILEDTPLNTAELDQIFATIIAGNYPDLQVAGLLATMHYRGEKPAEISAAARALLAAAHPFPTPAEAFIDSAGTGGDQKGTINISTAASILAAAAGGKVIKHGNVAISSQSGSADVIRELGIPTPDNAQTARELYDRYGYCFLFAPSFHPAVKRMMPIRTALGIPTVFNLIGPLLNPARPPRQMMGVGQAKHLPRVAETMRLLGREHAFVLHGSGLDEIALHGVTEIYEIRGEEMEHYQLTPADLNLPEVSLSELKGGDATANAATIKKIFAGTEQSAGRYAIVANTAALLYLLGKVSGLREGVELAQDTIADGTAQNYLAQLSTNSTNSTNSVSSTNQ